jgi:hypothetical protein
LTTHFLWISTLFGLGLARPVGSKVRSELILMQENSPSNVDVFDQTIVSSVPRCEFRPRFKGSSSLLLQPGHVGRRKGFEYGHLQPVALAPR